MDQNVQVMRIMHQHEVHVVQRVQHVVMEVGVLLLRVMEVVRHIVRHHEHVVKQQHDEHAIHIIDVVAQR